MVVVPCAVPWVVVPRVIHDHELASVEAELRFALEHGVEEALVTEWDNQLVALVVTKWEQLNVASLREKINSLLPKDSQLQKIETQSDPLEHTPKHSIKRYLYRKRAEWEARQAQVKGEK